MSEYIFCVRHNAIIYLNSQNFTLKIFDLMHMYIWYRKIGIYTTNLRDTIN